MPVHPGTKAVTRWLLSAAAVVALGQAARAQEVPPVGPDEMAFSTANMDPAVDPGTDFYRYAAGGWLDRVQRPERHAGYGFFEVVEDRVRLQMKSVLTRAGQGAATAEAGSPVQMVGTFFNAYTDLDARAAAGMAPIRRYLDAVDAVQTHDDLVRLMAQFAESGGPALFAFVGPDVDFADSAAYVFFVGAGQLGLPAQFEDVFEEPDGAPRISGYRTYLVEVQTIAALPVAEAERIADLSIGIERRLHAAKLAPVEASNPGKIYNPVTLEALQAQIPQLDLRLLMTSLDYPIPEQLILTEPRYFPVLSALLDELSMQDIRDYARLQTILAYSPYLDPAFDGPVLELNRALMGITELPPLEERALGLIVAEMGQPVSQIYVESYFPEATRAKAVEMIGHIKGAFQERMPGRTWLSDETRAAAIEKLAALSFKVGYPDQWIDYSGVQVTEDLVASVAALSQFEMDRRRGKLGKPVVPDAFTDPHTLPIVVNAAYDPSKNGFEVPAAIVQIPMFGASMDAAVNFCRMGAVLGHEMTHGFDWTGKQFDKDGNMRNWWQPADTAAFDARAAKLIAQADGYEVLPGLMASGALEVGENMADLGGITLAHAALRSYLAQHPDEDVMIDGLTQDQRCFIAWTQLWAWKGKEESLRSQVARDPHPPNAYRAVAPLLHLDAFYEAFGIEPGDPMWLDPALRVQAW